MAMQSDFVDGVPLFQEVPHKPPDLSRYQGAMFLDRPDLWPIIKRKSKPSALPGQQPLFTEGGN